MEDRTGNTHIEAFLVLVFLVTVGFTMIRCMSTQRLAALKKKGV